MQQNELFLMEQGRPEIDYTLISKALDFYKSIGYSYVEVPWIVPPEYTKITWEQPHGFYTKYGDLIGSAEQALVFMAINKQLKPNVKYVSCSPCFRDEPVDSIHQKSFFKVELFCFNINMVDQVLLHANDLFNSLNIYTEIIRTNTGFDLCSKNIELGSYGFREAKGIMWTYGTGLAEPRTSMVLKTKT